MQTALKHGSKRGSIRRAISASAEKIKEAADETGKAVGKVLNEIAPLKDLLHKCRIRLWINRNAPHAL